MAVKLTLTFLGTSAMVPTKERNHQSILLSYKTENILIDCGEGTQRQMRIAGIKPNSITKILISHWHGDHVLGLPGLLQTLAVNGYEKTLRIYGPKGTKQRIKWMLKAFEFTRRLNFKVKEVSNGTIFKSEDFRIESYKLEHKVPCVGYRFVENDKIRILPEKLKKFGIKQSPLVGKLQSGKSVIINHKRVKPEDVGFIEKGRIIGFVLDTGLCENCLRIAENADLLVSEATFKTELSDKAYEYSHLTIKDAAYIATRANVKKLVITHFSQRYKSTNEIEREAKEYFNNVKAAYDFLKVRV